MKKFNYNRQRHFELVQKMVDSTKPVTVEEWDEICTYSEMSASYLHWETHLYYLFLIEIFLSGKIDCWKFRAQFQNRYKLIEECHDKLEKNFIFLTPNKKSIQFYTFIEEIIGFGNSSSYRSIIESLDPVSDGITDETHARCHSEYQHFLESMNVKIQNLLKEQS